MRSKDSAFRKGEGRVSGKGDLSDQALLFFVHAQMQDPTCTITALDDNNFPLLLFSLLFWLRSGQVRLGNEKIRAEEKEKGPRKKQDEKKKKPKKK
jgi:hypothetical protein